MAEFKAICISNRAYIPNVDMDGNELSNQSLTCVIIGKLYNVLEQHDGWYRIIDETDEDYWYPSDMFLRCL